MGKQFFQKICEKLPEAAFDSVKPDRFEFQDPSKGTIVIGNRQTALGEAFYVGHLLPIAERSPGAKKCYTDECETPYYDVIRVGRSGHRQYYCQKCRTTYNDKRNTERQKQNELAYSMR